MKKIVKESNSHMLDIYNGLKNLQQNKLDNFNNNFSEKEKVKSSRALRNIDKFMNLDLSKSTSVFNINRRFKSLFHKIFQNKKYSSQTMKKTKKEKKKKMMKKKRKTKIMKKEKRKKMMKKKKEMMKMKEKKKRRKKMKMEIKKRRKRKIKRVKKIKKTRKKIKEKQKKKQRKKMVKRNKKKKILFLIKILNSRLLVQVITFYSMEMISL